MMLKKYSFQPNCLPPNHLLRKHVHKAHAGQYTLDTAPTTILNDTTDDFFHNHIETSVKTFGICEQTQVFQLIVG